MFYLSTILFQDFPGLSFPKGNIQSICLFVPMRLHKEAEKRFMSIVYKWTSSSFLTLFLEVLNTITR